MGDASSVTLHQLIARVESCDDASQATRYVDAIRLALSQALARRNATTTPGRLPFEILSMIFALLEISDLMHVTAVCRHWRAAGLDDARLWRTIDIQCHTYTSNWGQQISDDFDASYWERHMRYRPGEDEPHCIRDCAADAVSTNHHLLPLFLERSKSAMVVLKLGVKLHFSIDIAEIIAPSLHEHRSHIGSLIIDF
ncbi:hypothetical protein EXIGLDRAFT_758470 [Exidia glandulosa HHB12029]|uniref:F-box domain-containing protein n=1 Tax=Exidia glandulosa HHB12029 TaxID=1314781 RepID=A0A165QWP7_EXIGL|nr:hypothetical protein EXIGLDRAFT_758470 [Exidia glandulosa HHB12029]